MVGCTAQPRRRPDTAEENEKGILHGGTVEARPVPAPKISARAVRHVITVLGNAIEVDEGRTA